MSNNNNIEKFIQQNRSSFDEDRPSQDVWNEIEAALPRKKAKQFTIRDLYKFTAAAAIICITITSVYFLYIKKKNTETVSTLQPTTTNDDLKKLNPEYAAEANQFYQAIAARQEQLKTATTNEPELYKEFLSDLQVLDSTYKMLQKQALHTPNRDVIMKAMLQNLQLQAELLYRQLLITNELKQNKQQTTNAELKG